MLDLVLQFEILWLAVMLIKIGEEWGLKSQFYCGAPDNISDCTKFHNVRARQIQL